MVIRGYIMLCQLGISGAGFFAFVYSSGLCVGKSWFWQGWGLGYWLLVQQVRERLYLAVLARCVRWPSNLFIRGGLTLMTSTCWGRRKLPRSSVTALVCLFWLGPRARLSGLRRLLVQARAGPQVITHVGRWMAPRGFILHWRTCECIWLDILRTNITFLVWLCEYFVCCLALFQVIWSSKV